MSEFTARDIEYHLNEDKVVDYVTLIYSNQDSKLPLHISVEGLQDLLAHFNENPPEKVLSEDNQDLVGFCEFLSDLPFETLKSVIEDMQDEQELEFGLLDHLQRFLLELGVGFSFVGRQVHLEVGDQEFYIDLLFYHYKLRCFIVVELKATDFKPEFVEKLNFYLSVVDDKMRHPDDKPSIGLLLCKGKNKIVAQYALRDGISQHEAKIIESLPDELKGSLPSIERIEQELEDREDD